jgi:hypothetical protein
MEGAVVVYLKVQFQGFWRAEIWTADFLNDKPEH